MTGGPPSYSATCQHCGRVTVTTERFTDAELTRLRDHMRQAHAGVIRRVKFPPQSSSKIPPSP